MVSGVEEVRSRECKEGRDCSFPEACVRRLQRSLTVAGLVGAVKSPHVRGKGRGVPSCLSDSRPPRARRAVGDPLETVRVSYPASRDRY